jgi:hypothetical protein
LILGERSEVSFSFPEVYTWRAEPAVSSVTFDGRRKEIIKVLRVIFERVVVTWLLTKTEC